MLLVEAAAAVVVLVGVVEQGSEDDDLAETRLEKRVSAASAAAQMVRFDAAYILRTNQRRPAADVPSEMERLSYEAIIVDARASIGPSCFTSLSCSAAPTQSPRARHRCASSTNKNGSEM